MPEEVRDALSRISDAALEAIQQGLDDPIADLELLEFPQRYVNLLEEKGISLVRELLNYKWFELMAFKQFGIKGLIKLYGCFSRYDELKGLTSRLEREVVIGSR